MGYITPIIIFIVINLVVVILILLFMEKILNFMTTRCDSLGEFIKGNSGLFKILFTFCFFFEQVAIILLITWVFTLTKWMSAFVGIVALIVVTTAYFQAFIWEYKYQASQRNVGIITSDYGRVRRDIGKLIEENTKIIEEKNKLINENARLKDRLKN